MRWIIGDVHGMLRPLETLLAAIPKIDPQPLYYFVGDYMNRGVHSRGVVHLLLTLTNARFIRGNHDDVIDQVLHGSCYADNASRGDRFVVFRWFLEHGLLETLISYGVSSDQIGAVLEHSSVESLQPIIDQFPADHRQFMRDLPVFIEDDDLFVIHGKWPLKQKADPKSLLGDAQPSAELRHEVLWGRYTDADLHRKKNWVKRGFFGHTPVPTYNGYASSFEPIIAGKMVLLDTAAALSPHGRLTAYCPELDDYVQADPIGKLVKELRR